MKALRISNPLSSVIGVVSPIEWDENGVPINFSIFTEYGEDIIIINQDKLSRVRQLNNKVVEAHGKIFKGEDDEIFIRLKRIYPLGTSGAMTKSSPESFYEEELPIDIPSLTETWLDEDDYREFGYAI